MPAHHLQGLLLPIDHHWFNSLKDTQSVDDLGYTPPHMMYELHALRVLCAFCGTGSTAGRPGA
jgi:hypothetical protein